MPTLCFVARLNLLSIAAGIQVSAVFNSPLRSRALEHTIEFKRGLFEAVGRVPQRRLSVKRTGNPAKRDK